MKYYSLFSILSFLLVFTFSTEFVSAHGTFTTPVSRIYNCFLENPENPQSDSCKEAVAVGGKQALYDWNGVNQGNANDMHREIIPDGQLCGAGKELFKGMNLARDDWFTNVISPNQQGEIDFMFRATAPHSTEYFDFYITKDGYNPEVPLKWSDLEDEPFCSITEVQLENGNYNMVCPFPSGKTGKHLIYNIWQRDDSQEAFYTCIDVSIEGDDTGGGDDGYTSLGSIVANQDLSPGDKVKFRLFDENFADVETITKKLNERNYTADKWPFVLSKKINRKSAYVKAGVLNGEEIKPLKSPNENQVYIVGNTGYSFQIDIEMVSNPGGDDDDDCSCEEPTSGSGSEYDFLYPEGLGGYQPGTLVKGSDGNIYECRPFPNSGWCNGDSSFYEPGTGLAWEDAWIKIN